MPLNIKKGFSKKVQRLITQSIRDFKMVVDIQGKRKE